MNPVGDRVAQATGKMIEVADNEEEE